MYTVIFITINIIILSYDSIGPMAVKYNGTDYYYVLNAQGDVIAICSAGGNIVVSYEYDPWGKLLGTYGSLKDTLGQINPLTYRGYVYDRETGLYYLQSRYYSPELLRFICIDNTNIPTATLTNITDKNLFAYCDNNPINSLDNGGLFWIAAVAGAISGGIGQLLTDIANSAINGEWTFSGLGSYVSAIVGGAVGGVVTILAGTTIGSTVGNFAAGMTSSYLTMMVDNITGQSNRTNLEMLLESSMDGIYSAIFPELCKESFGFSGANIAKKIKSSNDNAVMKTVSDSIGGTFDGLGSNGWSVVKTQGQKANSQSMSLGRSLGYKPGEIYPYNGLKYVCY